MQNGANIAKQADADKRYQVGMVVFMFLTALVLGSNVYMLLWKFSGSIRDIIRLADVILVLLTVFYVVIGWKKPHGNLLKILMLIFTITIMPEALRDASSNWMIHAVLDMLGIICIAYVAGRLDRIEQNKYLVPLALALLLAARIVLELVYIPSVDMFVFIGRSSKVIVWLDICIAYFLRYKEHREAGLMDAPKK